MNASPENSAPSALRRIRALSRPIVVLLSIALGLLLVVRVPQILAVLFLFHGDGSWHGSVSFSEMGLGLFVYAGAYAAPVSGVMVETLTFSQRAVLALLAASATAFTGLAIYHLRRLFLLYSNGSVFERASAHHLGRFALWLAATTVTLNISGRLYHWITAAHPSGVSNAALTVICSGMIYIVARVMALAAEADEERREFI